ncbi:MAG: DUF488 domain-containing protein [Pirellulaceae bacterium]
MEIFTIGFTQSSAANFFGRLKNAGIRRLIDVRLNNKSQLAGFAKRDDLAYFLKELCDADYVHEPMLAPEQTMLDAYKKSGGAWSKYEVDFLELMRQRKIESHLSTNLFDVPTTLLCSEATADHCHRRLVIEYLQKHWPNVQAVHL